MLQFKHPGVYTREIPSGVRPITGAPTSTALFVGPTKSGIDARQIRILSFADFEREFGGLSHTSSLSYSVLHFFANGGGEAFVIRVPAKNSIAAKSAFKQHDASAEALSLTSLSSGAASDELFIELDPFGIDANPFSTTPAHDKKRFNLTLLDRLTGRVERFGQVSTASASARFAPAVVNDPATGSKLVKLAVAGIDQDGPRASGTIYKLGTAPTAGTFTADIKLRLSVAVLAADGTADSAGSLTSLAVTVFANGDAKPTSVLELVTRLVAALNAAIRADQPAADLMEGVAIEGTSLVEGSSTFIRLQTARPGNATLVKRLSDATVKITGPSSGTSFLTTYGLPTTPTSISPSRYQLGAKYGSSSQLFGTPESGFGGDASGQPDSDTFKKAVMDLDGPDPFFNLLCLPDIVRPAANDPMALHHSNAPTVYSEAALVCRKKHAFLLLDPPPDVTSVGAAESWKTVKITFQSSHAAAYFPNIRVDDPLVSGAIRSHPPSGAIAGLFARTDGQFGIWQSPAGTEASLAGVYGPSVSLSDEEQGLLNPIGLNCIRQFPIYGTVSFGSRTVDGANALGSEWKYIPVRRTASHILRTLSESLRWAVHKPNGEQLWSQLRVNVTAFMHGLFRLGAFKGVSARDAYFVQCDASTTTPDDINQGIVNIVVGFAPLKPAEFVVISLRQIVQPTV